MKDYTAPVLFCLIGMATFASWVNHLVICFSDDRWGFLIAGAIMFPIAIVHGAGNFMGLW
jgi:hypothetical protein